MRTKDFFGHYWDSPEAQAEELLSGSGLADGALEQLQERLSAHHDVLKSILARDETLRRELFIARGYNVED